MKSIQKPPFPAPHVLSRLESVTATASTSITRLETELSWYKHALAEKSVWARELVDKCDDLRSSRRRWQWATLALAICCTALGFRLI